MRKWWYRTNHSMRFMAQMGAFGPDAKKDADEVAEEQAIAIIFIVVIGILGYGGYLLLQLIGLI